jgi:nicotinamidase/pyrazinamidase
VISKAVTTERDAYSGFAGTKLAALLERLGARRLFVGGLATDYCVLHTVLDARALGHEVLVLRDAVAAVDAHPGDGDKAVASMRSAGARLVDSIEVSRRRHGPRLRLLNARAGSTPKLKAKETIT